MAPQLDPEERALFDAIRVAVPPPSNMFSSDANARHHEPKANNLEPNTCRICRCEATPTDPLFYPCKCSGSIKYVHQNCLMEWLSHSQKKYCELCKTQFRFTKLYNPDMPRALPLVIFSKHAVICLAQNALVWMRGVLVASVWLCWLPYLMRRLWTMLFWISDDGLDSLFSTAASLGPVNASEIAVLQGYAVSPSSPLTALRYCPPISQLSPAVYDQIVMATDIGGAVSARTYTISERIIFALLRILFPAPQTRAEMAAMALGAFGGPEQKHSLLGNVGWLRNLTSYPHLNKAIITVLEGQFITIVVIVCFILIILVRDYVVQHQPELNGQENELAAGQDLNADFDQDEEDDQEDSDDNAELSDSDLEGDVPYEHEPARQIFEGNVPYEHEPVRQVLDDNVPHEHEQVRRAPEDDVPREHEPVRRAPEDDAPHEPESARRVHPDGLIRHKLETVLHQYHLDIAGWTIEDAKGQLEKSLPGLEDPIYHHDSIRLALEIQKLATFEEKVDFLVKNTRLNYRPPDQDTLDDFLRLLIFSHGNFGVILIRLDQGILFCMDDNLRAAMKEHVDTHPTLDDSQILFIRPCDPEDALHGFPFPYLREDNTVVNGHSDNSVALPTEAETEPEPETDTFPMPNGSSYRNAGEGPSNPRTREEDICANRIDKGKSVARRDTPPPPEFHMRNLDSPMTRFEDLHVEGVDGLPLEAPAYTRSRSQSDGPPVRNTSFLANNSWTVEPSSSLDPLSSVEQSSQSVHEKPSASHEEPSQFVYSEPSQERQDLSQELASQPVDNLQASFQAAGWSFATLESQPSFSRTRDEDEAPFLDSSPTHPNSIYSSNISQPSNHHSRVASSSRIEEEMASNHDSEWESLSEGADDRNEQQLPTHHSDSDDDDGDAFRRFDRMGAFQAHEEIHHQARYRNLLRADPTIIIPADEVLHVEDTDVEHQEDHINQAENRRQDNDDEAPGLGGFEAGDEGNADLAAWETDSDATGLELDENDAMAVPHHINVRRQRRRERQRNEEQAQRRVANLPGIMAQFMWGGIADEADGLIPLLDAADVNAEGGNDAGVDDDRWLDIRFDDGLDDGFDNEEFEGMMELIGMAGPIFGLFQNAMFCICLVLISLIICVVFPYNIGRATAWFLASPLRMVRLVFAFVSLVQDMAAFTCGMTAYILSSPMYYIGKIAGWDKTSRDVGRVLHASYGLSSDALGRLGDTFWTDVILPTEFRSFSVITHAAVNTIKHTIASSVGFVFISVYTAAVLAWQSAIMLVHPLRWNIPYAVGTVAQGVPVVAQVAKKLDVTGAVSRLINPTTWVISINTTEDYSSLDASLVYWSGWDRAFVIVLGYLTLTAMAVLFLKRTHVGSGILGLEAHVALVEGLVQAGGVMKVLLIISIEMLLFPLYCGILMDVALLPLFEAATLQSRFDFAMRNPMTSMFVHWFVGTGYMFHFALFVAMCRKIMRKGVLYFIRDPDDPEFHPIREVLERKFFTQVRKIMFSALVYGTLVIVCLGSVVWGLSYYIPGLFPIHYSSNEPVLEFPIDLLFYNFLMPLAVKFFKPSDGIQIMYTWCFRRAGRMLRLTGYLFGEREVDEEGVLMDGKGNPVPWHVKMRMDYNGGGFFKAVTLADFFGSTKRQRPTGWDEWGDQLEIEKRLLIAHNVLVPDGRFVYAPASDQVRIVRGRRVFIRMKERDLYKDDAPPNYQAVYLPPHFYKRVAAFVLCLWAFAATTGVTLTVIPLAVGRYIFTALLPDHVRTNDIYAFTIGVYVLASVGWLTMRANEMGARVASAAERLKHVLTHPESASRSVALAIKAAKVVYTYTMMVLVFPILTAMLVELYVLVPLHSYFYPSAEPGNRHVIPIIQTWTLGILYLKLGTRIISRRHANSRFHRALRAVTRRGLLNPRVGLFTRAFVVPGVALSLVAIVAPPALMDFTIATNVLAPMSDEAAVRALMYRMSYPLTALWVGLLLGLNVFFGLATAWSNRIRDEAYLIGTRLHNFGEAKRVATGRREAMI